VSPCSKSPGSVAFPHQLKSSHASTHAKESVRTEGGLELWGLGLWAQTQTIRSRLLGMAVPVQRPCCQSQAEKGVALRLTLGNASMATPTPTISQARLCVFEGSLPFQPTRSRAVHQSQRGALVLFCLSCLPAAGDDSVAWNVTSRLRNGTLEDPARQPFRPESKCLLYFTSYTLIRMHEVYIRWEGMAPVMQRADHSVIRRFSTRPSDRGRTRDPVVAGCLKHGDVACSRIPRQQ
jgi:hypothetical protein